LSFARRDLGIAAVVRDFLAFLRRTLGLPHSQIWRRLILQLPTMPKYYIIPPNSTASTPWAIETRETFETREVGTTLRVSARFPSSPARRKRWIFPVIAGDKSRHHLQL
jgi:hypothetical protein